MSGYLTFGKDRGAANRPTKRVPRRAFLAMIEPGARFRGRAYGKEEV